MSHSPVFDQTGMADHNGWTHPACELLSNIWTDQNHLWNPSRRWVALQYLKRFEPLMKMWNICPVCESLLNVSRSEPLTELAFRRWVSPVFEQLNHWWEWLNMHPASELLFSIRADQNHWQEWLIMHSGSGCELFPIVWENQNHWWEGLIMDPASGSLFSVWSDQNHWWKWLNTNSGCEFLFGNWADQNYW